MTDLVAIWKRLRKKMDLSKVSGRTPKEWKKNFIKTLKEDKYAKNLVKKGAGRNFFNLTKKEGVLPREARVISRVFDQKTVILSGRGKTKTFNTENLKYKKGQFKGRNVEYVYNSRTKRRVAIIFLEGKTAAEKKQKKASEEIFEEASPGVV